VDHVEGAAEVMNADAPVSLYLVVPPSDLARTRPIVRLMLNQIGRRLTESLQVGPRTAYRHRLLVLLDLQRRPKCDPVMALWVIHPGRPARARRRRDRDPPRARSAILNRDGRPGHLSAIHAGYWSISAAMMDLAIPRRRRVRPTLAAHDGGTPRPRRR
jgi:hypothetical protein